MGAKFPSPPPKKYFSGPMVLHCPHPVSQQTRERLREAMLRNDAPILALENGMKFERPQAIMPRVGKRFRGAIGRSML